jgi:cyclopropane fatty-acyl-phospholipid synthase-like methyltransferase
MFYGSEPATQLQRTLDKFRLPPGRALDVGCGDGRNALFLAQRGYEVTAIDTSPAAISKLDQISETNRLAIVARCEDIRSVRYPVEHYDLVVAHTVIDHLSEEEGNALVVRLKHSLRKGGAFYAAVFTTEDPACADGTSGSDTMHLVQRFFAPHELPSLFSDMNILDYNEERFLSRSHGEPHYHAVAVILASKA